MPTSTPLLAPPETTELALLRPLPVASVTRVTPSTVTVRQAPALTPPLPVLLAGPIVRRTEPSRVLIWVATSAPVSVEGRVLLPAGGDFLSDPAGWRVVGGGRTESVRIGERLFITLVALAPRGVQAFPHGTVLAYDLTFHAAAGWEFFNATGLTIPERVLYAGSRLPTFFLGPPPEQGTSRLVHGSCTKPHGGGTSAMTRFDQDLSQVLTDTELRPSAFLLTGDQIYADDVTWQILRAVETAAPLLIGVRERFPLEESFPSRTTPVRYAPDLDPLPGQDLSQALTRGRYLTDRGLATAPHPDHLMTFGELCGMHLLSWSDVLWHHAPITEQMAGFGGATAARATGRVMANMSSYMMFDDHDVTDDWPLTSTSFNRVNGTGPDATNPRWVVSCAMAAIWFFQMQGNTGAPEPELARVTGQYVDAQRATPQGMAQAELSDFFLLGIEEFSREFFRKSNYGFVAPTVPPVVFLDTHTQRTLFADRPPELLSRAAIGRLAQLLPAINSLPAGAPLMLVSPAPVIGPPAILTVNRQSRSLRPGHPLDPDEDPDWWLDTPLALRRLLRTLMDHVAGTQRRIVVFSGDYHFGYTTAACLVDRPAPSPSFRAVGLYQLTSSPIKNRMSASQESDWGWVEMLVPWTGPQTAWLQSALSGSVDFEGGPLRNVNGPVAAIQAGASPYMLLRYVNDAFIENHVGWATISWTATGTITVEHRLVGNQRTRRDAVAALDPNAAVTDPDSWFR